MNPSDKTLRARLRPWLAFVRGRKRLTTGLLILVLFYLAALCADFLAPYDYRAQSRLEPMAPPASLHFRDAQGNWHLRPFVYGQRLADPLTRSYTEDTTRVYRLTFFVRGYGYKFLGIFPTTLHLFGVREEGQASEPRVYLLGADALGRDRLSRILMAARFSLLVGPLGTLLASMLGILLGCLAGFSGRVLDALLMRAADVMMALPTLVLVLAARAAFPLELPPLRAGLMLIVIFIVVGWAEMARLARGQVLELRNRDFVLAAYSLGLSPPRVLWRHILPNMSRPLLVQVTLMIPAFLLAETALSYLGVGLQEPEPSWGNLLSAAGDLTLLQAQPGVVLAPALAIFVFVLGVRLVGDGLQRLKPR